MDVKTEKPKLKAPKREDYLRWVRSKMIQANKVRNDTGTNRTA